MIGHCSQSWCKYGYCHYHAFRRDKAEGLLWEKIFLAGEADRRAKTQASSTSVIKQADVPMRESALTFPSNCRD